MTGRRGFPLLQNTFQDSIGLIKGSSHSHIIKILEVSRPAAYLSTVKALAERIEKRCQLIELLDASGNSLGRDNSSFPMEEGVCQAGYLLPEIGDGGVIRCNRQINQNEVILRPDLLPGIGQTPHRIAAIE
jgi:hypothetical protein